MTPFAHAALVIPRWALRIVCDGLERSCRLLHWLPGYACQLALWSHALDEKYDLGVWGESRPASEVYADDLD